MSFDKFCLPPQCYLLQQQGNSQIGTKRGIFLIGVWCEYKIKGFIQKSIYSRNFFSRQNQISVNPSIIWCFSTQPTLRAWNEIDFPFLKMFPFDISSKNKIKVGSFNIFLVCRLLCKKMSVIYDHIVSEWHIEDHHRQHHAHHDHCHHVIGQEGGTWGSGSYFICLLLPPLRVGRGKGGVLSLFPNIFPHIAEKKISLSPSITSALFSHYSW